MLDVHVPGDGIRQAFRLDTQLRSGLRPLEVGRRDRQLADHGKSSGRGLTQGQGPRLITGNGPVFRIPFYVPIGRKASRILLASGSLGGLMRELPEASVPSTNALSQDANALSQGRKVQSQRLQELHAESAAGAASRLRTPSAGLLTPRGWPEARSPARCARLQRRGCSGRGRRRRLSSRPQAQGPCPPAPRPSGRA